MPYRRTPRIEARLGASRDRIRAAALAVVAEQGYAGCSIAAVARRAGVATGSVYRHFPSKSDLVAEVFRVASQREVDAFTRAASPDRAAAESVAAVIETFAGRALRAPRMAYALLAEPVDPSVDAERLVFRRAYAAVLAEIISRGIAAGELPDQDVDVGAAALVGAIGEALVGPLAVGAGRPADPDPPGAPPQPVGPALPARTDAAADGRARAHLISHLIAFAQRSIGAVSDNA
ncbi:TetR/AcrR family transcriptional regulator [Actinoallomurus soli]|uniref:TetR/AcrR family transcriptional regulator n=1 Tax=Actinoallomurus soli TaxID=2952535 RepID=UPI0020923759|nr:TetR/AcrR family transcriptional regulator [Actinoallomurus soli]MCO5970519.1 TetR/AcrR family transcriptional regulator [Actinoallomurus soli]